MQFVLVVSAKIISNCAAKGSKMPLYHALVFTRSFDELDYYYELAIKKLRGKANTQIINSILLSSSYTMRHFVKRSNKIFPLLK